MNLFENTGLGQTEKQLVDHLDAKWGKLSENINGYPNIKDEQTRINLMKMLENTESYYKTLSDADMTTTTTAANVNSGGVMIPKIIPPIIRRVYPALITNDLVSTQPLMVPEGKMFFLDFQTVNASGTDVRNDLMANYSKDYANSAGEGAAIKSMSLKLSSTPISAVAKKLKATWSKELQQDLTAYTGLSVYNEMIASIADQIKLEIEGGLISLMVGSASAGNVDWHVTPASGDTTTADKKAYRSTIYEAVIDAANMIYKKRYVYPTWIIADADTCGRLEKLEDFKLSSVLEQDFSISRQLVGTLGNRFKVYKDPFFLEALGIAVPATPIGKMLLGFNNPNRTYHTGCVWAPYILAYLTQVLENPETMISAVGFMSRYGTKVVVGDMFSTVSVIA